MTQEDILNDIQIIFRNVLQDDKLEIQPTLMQGSIDNWDSLNHAIIIEKIEKHYNIKFGLMDMISIETIGDICKSVMSKKSPD